MKSSNGTIVGLLCLIIVLEITGKALTFKTICLSILITAVLLGAAFGIYCLVEWFKEKKNKQVDGK